MNTILAIDFEAHTSLVHTYAYIVGETGYTDMPVGIKMRSGRQGLQPVKITKILESGIIKINDVKFNNLDKSTKEHLNNKHLNDMNIMHDNEFGVYKTMSSMSFRESMLHLLDVAAKYNNIILIGHCLPRDFGFLLATQKHVGGKVIINDNILTIPKIGVNDPRWKNITLICSQTMFCIRCSKFMAKYNEHAITTISGKYNKTDQENFSKFVQGPNYIHLHSAGKDTIDLFKNIMYAYDLDGDQMFAKYDCISVDKFEMLPRATNSITDGQKRCISALLRFATQDLLDEIGDFKLNQSQASDIINKLRILEV